MRTEKPGMIAKDYFQISITHIPTGNDVSFDAWVTGFADSFASSWKGTPVYGRMDDLYNFQKTSRKISLAFDVVAANKFEAAKNVRKLNKLAQFLYPVYSAPQGDLGTPNSQTLQAAPLLKVKWNGLISNALDGAGLVGFLNGFSYSPEIESGQFFVKGRGSGKPFMAYQLHRVQFEYTVLHTHLTGWTTRTVDLGGGVSKHIFGGDDARELGSTFPHAISDPIILPTEGDAADETEPDPAAPAPADAATNGEQTPQDPPATDDDAEPLPNEGARGPNQLREAQAARLLSRDATSAATLPEGERGVLDTDLSSILGDRSW